MSSRKTKDQQQQPVEKTIKQRLEEYKPIEVPYPVWCAFAESKYTIHISADTCALTGTSGDFVDLERARSAVAWYVRQLGGKVTWKD